MIVIGAGIIGLELRARSGAGLGASVTVVEFLDRIIPGADEEVAKTFQRALTKQGMVFKLGAKVTGRQGFPAKGVEVTIEPVTGGAAQGPLRRVRAVGYRP